MIHMLERGHCLRLLQDVLEGEQGFLNLYALRHASDSKQVAALQ